MQVKTNLKIIKKTSKSPITGDIFAIQLPSMKYIFGRVISAEPPREISPMPLSYLIYIYSFQSDIEIPNYEKLTPDNLLLSPIWTNRLGWKKGYFQIISNQPLVADVLLSQHCFRRYNGSFVDEVGQKLTRRTEPCGEWGLVSYRWIDDHVSDAIGIPRVPENK